MVNRAVIQQYAINLRKKLSLGPYDPIDTHGLLEKLDVFTAFKDMSSDFSGMAIKTPESNFILINSSSTIGRQNFTIMHEIYHLFFQEAFSVAICQPEIFNRRLTDEYYADLFAAYILMPRDGILQMIPSKELIQNQIQLETILKIEQFYKCSRSALLNQLREIGIIDNNKAQEFKPDIKINAEKFGYMMDLYNPGNNGKIIGNYKVKLDDLLKDEKISLSLHNSLLQVFNKFTEGISNFEDTGF